MKKKNILWILLDIVFLAVFNTVFFMVGGTDHPASAWISYGFIHFSYLMILVTPFLIRKSSSQAVLGFSLYSVSAVYFFVEFIAGLVFIFISSESYKASLVVQVIISGIYAVMLISNLIANEYTADSVEQHEDEVAYIKNAASRVKILIGKASDKKANKEIERAYDLLHSSPSKSNNAVAPLESAILRAIYELESAVSSKDEDAIFSKSREIISLAETRNDELKKLN
ncbi:MAG: hypothetical protein ACI4YB_06945 [Oscillospiraceae bacterium]